MKDFLGALLVPIFGTTLVASAHADSLSWYLYPSAYYAASDSDLHARNDYGFQFTLGAQIDPHWAIEAQSETSNFKYKDHSATVAQRGVSVQGLFIPYPELSLAPFISLGGGWLHTHAGGLRDDIPLARGGVGVQWLSQEYPIGA